MITTIRTTVGRENSVIKSLANKIKSMGFNVKSLFHPEELKGYIFLEADINTAEKLISGVPHVRSIIRKNISIEELRHFLENKKTEIVVNRGDVVEIISGPFKGERGKITRVDDTKHEVTVEFLEAAVPIPITVATDSVRVVEKAEEEK